MNPIGYIGLDAAQRLETINLGLTTTITKHRAFNDDVELWAGGWQPIDTAPEDEHILIATSGGHVGTAYWTDEGDGKVWAWGHPEKDHGQYVHPKLEPLGWMPLPKHPDAA